MLSRNLSKLILTGVILLWAVFSLLPLEDRDFGQFVRGEATAKQAEFNKLVDQAAARAAARQAPSVYIALRQITRAERVDLLEFFPKLNVGDVKNVERRNDLILEHLLKESKASLPLGLDLKGGVAITLEAPAAELANVDDFERQAKLEKAVDIISRRINGLGVTEPVIRPVGDRRIEIQLPGVNTKDDPEVVNSIKKPARLDFRLVHEGTGSFQEPPRDIPPGYEAMPMEEEEKTTGRTYTVYYIVKIRAEMTGENVDNAVARIDEIGGFQVHLNFNSAGATQFGNVTTANVGRLLGIVLDGRLYSAPRINEPITGGSAQITGRFSQREALQLSNVLNNPLDVSLNVVEQYEIGPTLAKDSIDSATKAFIISTSLTILFIVFFYTTGGFLACVAMCANIAIILGVMANIGATMTLPGIAGIVLTLAMSVDSNILIFERMREELRLGKSLKVALEAGFDKAFSAILDGNLTTLITAVVMWSLGTGPVKGFGVTLTIGIFTTMFAALIVSRLLLELVIHTDTLKSIKMFSVLQDTKYDFLKFAKPAFIASWVIVLVGVGVVAYKGRSIYGIDFTGGDSFALTFTKKVDLTQIREVGAKAGLREVNPSYQKQIGSDFEVLRVQTPFDEGAAFAAKLKQAFPDAGFADAGSTRIGPAVGKEIQWNALIGLVVSLTLILVYVAFRFEFGYGVGAVIATVHDLLMTVGIFVLFDRQFNASMVAAILLVAGYSINDTIVVFDRIREELKLNPTGSLRDIINRSLNLTLSRTIITGGTTFLSAVTLLAITGGDVNDIAFTLLIGIITGTFSSLYIASPVFYWWHKGDRKHVEAHHDIAPKYEWAGSSRASE
jgi:SecD/SecF fusion protein